MTNLEIIEKECQHVNKILLEEITIRRPVESVSKTRYVMLLDPIQYGSEQEYADGDYDAIIDLHFQEISNAFDQQEIDMGIRPAMSFEEFMGDSYKGEPLQTTEELEYKIKSAMHQKPLPSSMPAILVDDITERREKYLTDVMIDVKLENYAKTTAEFEYIDLYNEYHEKYQNLFKPWPDENL